MSTTPADTTDAEFLAQRWHDARRPIASSLVSWRSVSGRYRDSMVAAAQSLIDAGLVDLEKLAEQRDPAKKVVEGIFQRNWPSAEAAFNPRTVQALREAYEAGVAAR